MRVFQRIEQAWEERALASGRLGLVPTMGALHEGHAALMRRCRAESDVAAISIFVNPRQFDSSDDLSAYPRDLQRDLDLAEAAGIDLVWTPASDDIYPDGFATTVTVAGVSERWEGAARPGHFAGVATVVAKLLTVLRPDLAYFGRKDAQQLAVVRRLVADLGTPTDIVACATVREADGLALSSRNQRLEPDARQRATALHESLRAVAGAYGRGLRQVDELLAAGAGVVSAAADSVDYLALVDPGTFDEAVAVSPTTLIIGAARFGSVRLIDNLPVDPAAAQGGQ